MTSTMCLQSSARLPDDSLATTTEGAKASETTEKVPKRKSTEPSMVLGPCPAEIEVAQPTKKSKVADEAETRKDLTITERRLQQVSNVPPYEDIADRIKVLTTITTTMSGINKCFENVRLAVRGLESSMCQLQAQLSNMQGMVDKEREQAFCAVADSIFGHIDFTDLESYVWPGEREWQAPKFPVTRVPSQDPKQTLDTPTSWSKLRLSTFYPSLLMMWDEWHGTGGIATKDKPIPGGFRDLELMSTKIWRRHFNTEEKRHCKQVRLIMEGIERMAELLEMTEESARDQLEKEWTRLNKSPDAMVRYLQGLGYVKKAKSRAKRA